MASKQVCRRAKIIYERQIILTLVCIVAAQKVGSGIKKGALVSEYMRRTNHLNNIGYF